MAVPEQRPVPDVRERSCPLCGTDIGAHERRCPSCGFHLVAAGKSPFTTRALWALAGLVLACYVVSILVVAAAR